MRAISSGLAFFGILLGLDHHPAGIADVREHLRDRSEVDRAVARDGEYAFDHALEERPVLRLEAREHVRPDVLAMDVIDTPAVAARGREHVAPGEVEMPGIEQQAHGIAGPRHQQIDLAFALDHRAHVVVEGHRATGSSAAGRGIGRRRRRPRSRPPTHLLRGLVAGRLGRPALRRRRMARACRQHPKPGARSQQPGDQLGDSRQQVLAVVDDHHDVTGGE